MGMHEIESAVEWSVIFLDQQIKDPEELRSLFWNLYNFQAFFDTSHTHFRVADILINRRFMYQLNKEDYPDYHLYQAILNGSDTSWIRQHPDQEWETTFNPTVALLNSEDGLIYFDAGSYPWRRLVSSGYYTGLDAQVPRKIPFADMVNTLFSHAQQNNDTHIARTWFSLFPQYLYWTQGNSADYAALQANSTIQSMQEIAAQMDLISMTDDEWDYGVLRIPTEEDMQQSSIGQAFQDFLMWWLYSKGTS